MARNSSWLPLKWQLSYMSSELQREALRKMAEIGDWSRNSAITTRIVTPASLFLQNCPVDWMGQHQTLQVWWGPTGTELCFSLLQSWSNSVIRSQIRLSHLKYPVSTLGQESLSTGGPVQTSHARVIPPLCENKQKLKALVGERNCVNMNR